MAKQCINCGAQISDEALFCEKCGARQDAATTQPPITPQPAPEQAYRPQMPSFKISIPNNPVALIAAIFAAVLFLLSFIIMLVDSSTILNRLYTTALLWQLPLLTIAMIIYVFLKHKDECKILAWIATVLMVLTFLFTNYSKNIIQDTLSNTDNYVDIAAEAVVDNIDKVRDWEDVIGDAVRKATKSQRDYDEEDYDW